MSQTLRIAAALAVALGAGASLLVPLHAEDKAVPAWGAKIAKPVDKASTAAKSGKAIETGAIPATAPLETEAFADWVRECKTTPEAKICNLRQTVRDDKKRRIVEFVAMKTKTAAFMEVRLPLGLSIPYGVVIAVSDTIKLPTQLVDCNLGGCRSVLVLNDKSLAALKGAKAIKVIFQDSKSGKIITISGSPKGFDDGIAKLLKPV